VQLHPHELHQRGAPGIAGLAEPAVGLLEQVEGRARFVGADALDREEGVRERDLAGDRRTTGQGTDSVRTARRATVWVDPPAQEAP
jgi:hypothetical protein